MEELYRNYYRKLLCFTLQLTGGDRTLSEDLVQDTFIRALQNMHVLLELNEMQKRTWLYKTAKNLFIDAMRKSRREQTLKDTDIGEDDLSFIDVKELCQKLTKEERQLYHLRYELDYNSAEIGELLFLASSTVRVKLMALRKRLKELYLERKE